MNKSKDRVIEAMFSQLVVSSTFQKSTQTKDGRAELYLHENGMNVSRLVNAHGETTLLTIWGEEN